MVKHLTGPCKVLMIALFITVMSVLYWLHADVRSLEWARPRIEAALNPENAPYHITYGSAELDWRDWTQFGLLEVKNVSIARVDGVPFAKFPAVYVNFSPLGILTHGHALHTIELRQPKLLLTRDENRVVRLGLDSDAQAMPLSDLLGAPAGGTDNDGATINFKTTLPFRKLVVRQAQVKFTDTATDTTITSDHVNFSISHGLRGLEASATIPFIYNDVPGRIEATLRQSVSSDAHIATANLQNAPAQFACIVTSCEQGVELEGPISGKVTAALDDHAKPLSTDVNLNVQNATFTLPKIFADPLKVPHALVQLHAKDHLRQVTLTRLSLDVGDVGFEITGKAHQDGDGWYVDAGGRGTRPLAIAKLYKYWPLGLASDSRAWVLDSMKAGQGNQLYMNLKLTPTDFTAPNISDTALDAGLIAEDVTTEYLKGFPLMKHIHAVVHFTGTTARIEADTGNVLTGTQLLHSVIFFPDLNKAGTPVEVQNTSLKGPANDAAVILNLKYFDFSKPLKLDPATITGNVDSTMNLKFDAFSHEAPGVAVATKSDDIDFSHVVYDISTKLRNLAQPKFAGRFDIAALDGDLSANNDGMQVKSTLKLNGTMPLAVNASQKSGGDVLLDVSGDIGRGVMAQFGLPENDRIGDGSAKVDAQIVAKKDTVLLKNVAIDFTNLACNISELSWSKKQGVAGTFSIKQQKPNEYNVNLTSDDLHIENAKLQLANDGTVAQLTVPKVLSAQNDFAATYRTRKDGFDVSLTGKKLDASASYAKSDNGALSDFPPIHLNVDLAKLVLMPEEPFTNVKGTLQCNPQRCDTANIRANLGKGNLAVAIAQNAGQRQMTASASDTGALLRALNFTDRMYGGTLDMHGTYNDRQNPPAFNGQALVTDFKVKNSAILGRIFSIGSLTGLSNALTGSGIAFDKLNAQISEKAGVITLKDSGAHGTAMGITVKGTVDTNTSVLKLRGVVVPAYALNSLIGRIPLIGALAGGEGEGIIAFNYSVNGTYEKPDVSMNPLSGLTPGFLRGIFHIFDSDDKTPEKKSDTDQSANETESKDAE